MTVPEACDATGVYYQQYVDITEQLQCPVCGGQRIASSDSHFAVMVKHDVCQYLQEGLSGDAVIARVEQEYSQNMRVDDGSVALMPLILLLAVLLLAGLWKLYRLRSRESTL